jgi:CubicO group peptidase (beta-lactamase class C family)
MKKRMSLVVRAFALVFAFYLAGAAGVVSVAQTPAQAQTQAQATDISGIWQGTLAAGPGLRIILKVSRTPAGYIATMYSIDQGSGPIPVTSITLDGSAMKFAVAPLNGSYAGTLSANGNSIAGTWTQNSGPLPLNLARPTAATAWEIPDPAKGHTQIAVDAKILDRYAGKYQLGPQAQTIGVARSGDHLTLGRPGGQGLDIFPEGEKEFFARGAPLQVSFHTDAQGAVTEFVLHQGGRDITARRVAEVSADAAKARFAQIDAMVAAAFAKRPYGGVTIGVVQGKQWVWTSSYGDADMEKKLPAEKDTVYRIGSVTKMFTALMLEQLADSGKLRLSDPAEKYLPEVKLVPGATPDAPPITLIQLATHTSGLGREPDHTATYVKGPVADWEKTLVAALPQTHHIADPGTRFSYSNIGYAVLGAALSHAAGEPYVDYVPRHIFAPLGMSHSSLDTTDAMLPHLSVGYDVTGTKADATVSQRELKTGRGYKVPNGAIFTTVGDMAHFASFLMGDGPDEGVLPTADLKRYQQDVVPADVGLTNGYGIGFMVERRDNYIAFGHGGAVSGYQAALEINLNAEVGVIVLANSVGDGAIDSEALALQSLDLLSK